MSDGTRESARGVRAERSPGRAYLAILGLNAGVAALLFASGCIAFACFTGGMTNNLARTAREQHLGLVILCNLRTAPGYLVLMAAYTAAGASVVLRTRVARRGRLPALGLAVLGANSLVFLLSAGPIIRRNPGVLDAFARHVASRVSWLDPYTLERLHVIDGLCAGAALLALWALVFHVRILLRGLKARPFVAAAASGVAVTGLALAVLGSGRGARGTTASSPERLPNILILAADSLRADHLSCHGYPRPVTPRIDAFAREAADFTSMHVAAASTLESWLTTLYSQFPHSHGIRYMFPSKEDAARVSARPDSLVRILRDRGYRTSVVSNWAGNCFHLVDTGFQHNLASDVQNLDVFITEAVFRTHVLIPCHFNNSLGEFLFPGLRQVTSYLNPSVLARRMKQEMTRAGEEGRPFFGLLFFSATHLPFLSSWPYNVKFTDPAYRGPNRYQVEFCVDTFIQGGYRDALRPDEVRHIVDLYDGAVNEFDDQVGAFLDHLRAEGLLDETIVIVTSDHGEDLYEDHVTLGHGTSFFGGDQSTRIPFLVRFPDGRGRGRRVEGMARNVDIAPTLLDALGVPAPASWQGVSLLPYVDGTAEDLGLPAFAETCYLFFPKRGPGLPELRVAPLDETLSVDESFRNQLVLRKEYHDYVIATKDRMMRTERWKLIQTPREGRYVTRFYDMAADPSARHDLSGEGLPVMRRMEACLERWWGGAHDIRWTRSDDAAER